MSLETFEIKKEMIDLMFDEFWNSYMDAKRKVYEEAIEEGSLIVVAENGSHAGRWYWDCDICNMYERHNYCFKEIPGRVCHACGERYASELEQDINSKSYGEDAISPEEVDKYALEKRGWDLWEIQHKRWVEKHGE